MELKNNPALELDDDQLAQVSGGAINIFYDMPKNQVYYKYTCKSCGNVGITSGWPDACNECGCTDIHREEYNP